MKKVLATLIFGLVSASAMATTQPSSPTQGGFTGPTAAAVLTTVQDAQSASDDTHVQLTGYIVSSLGNEDYMFKDSTGEIKVEIDNHDWNGVNATPTTKIVIRGEVDKDWNEVSVDAKTVSLAN